MSKKIILHCSDSSYGNAALITKWHILPPPDGNSWDKIGYHYVILNGRIDAKNYDEYLNGLLETGRQENEPGAHCRGHNDSIGICLIGRSHGFTERQVETLFFILRSLKQKYGQIEVKQHSDFDDKKYFCAGFTPEEMQTFNRV